MSFHPRPFRLFDSRGSSSGDRLDLDLDLVRLGQKNSSERGKHARGRVSGSYSTRGRDVLHVWDVWDVLRALNAHHDPVGWLDQDGRPDLELLRDLDVHPAAGLLLGWDERNGSDVRCEPDVLQASAEWLDRGSLCSDSLRVLPCDLLGSDGLPDERSERCFGFLGRCGDAAGELALRHDVDVACERGSLAEDDRSRVG